MVRRRVASQVHEQVSRLMRGNYIKKEPAWFKAVLDNPPLTLPPKSPPPRTSYDLKLMSPTKHRSRSLRPLPIYYIEDDIRRQFFKDHPFETFRPTTLTESDQIECMHAITGVEWKRLRQRGRNPASEDAVKFCLNLYQHHGLSLSDSYTAAVSQYRALRSEHHVSTMFAVMEAQNYGSTFGPTEIENSFDLQKRSLQTWNRKEEADEGALTARKRWKLIVEKAQGVNQWSKGEEYVRLWQEGVRPNYMPALTEPISDSSSPSQII